MTFSKTKLVATLGPSSDSYEIIKDMALNGLDLVRINMSHGKHSEHAQKIEIIEKLRKEGHLLAIMLDLKGPKIRCGNFENDGVDFKKGDITRIVKEDVLGTKERFTTTYKDLYNDLSVNDKFTLDDGILGFKVISKEENETLKNENKVLRNKLNIHMNNELDLMLKLKGFKDYIKALENKILQ